jgi:hypothetical protein
MKMLDQKENLFFRSDKMIDEYLLNTYFDMDEQELEVCRTIVWVMSDLNSGYNEAYYMEVVARLLDPGSVRIDIFATIQDIEDTIQRLVNKGILFQRIDRIGILDKDGESRWTLDEPFITLSFTKEPIEAIKAINESFFQELSGFFVPHKG